MRQIHGNGDEFFGGTKYDEISWKLFRDDQKRTNGTISRYLLRSPPIAPSRSLSNTCAHAAKSEGEARAPHRLFFNKKIENNY